jgi:DNA-binding Xre family transcriptional regulator
MTDIERSVSYVPLLRTLEEKHITLNDLRRGRGDYNILHPTIIAQINRNELISMENILKICTALNVPIEKVVKVNL